MHRRASGLIWVLFLSCAAIPALAQATRPAEEDVVLPPRHGATTQATGISSVISGGGSGDAFDIKRLALALGIVLVAIFVSQKAWKRFGMPGLGVRSSGALQVVSRLSVSPKQQILLVRVGRRLVLVGNSGTQMNSLCEIADPEEAALLLGQTATERDGSITTSFNSVLGGAEKSFEEEVHPETTEDQELATTREEINGLMEKVRGMSKQFRRA